MGVFSRSAALRVQAEQTVLQPGDFVTGVVTLTVHKEIEAHELLITLEGKEHLKWETSSGDSTSTHHKHHELFVFPVHYEVPSTLQPGESSHPFSFQLPQGIPASFEYTSWRVGFMEKVKVHTEYRIKAKLVRKGMLTMDVKEKLALVVKPGVETLATTPHAKPVAASSSQVVRMMGLFKRGQCHVRMDMRSDVISLGTEVKLTAFVDNESKQKIKDLRIILYEDVVVDREHNNDKGVEKQSQRVIKQHLDAELVNEIVNGKPIALALPIQSEKEEVLPSMSSYFIRSLNYRIAVEVSLSVSPRVKVDVPVRLLSKEYVNVFASSPVKLQCLA
ncbi:hypothetical protein Poli38472_010119 [Pythium oligandrum]|uniref:Arrestin C-terminal-like domain-containing protein n=1 Tax=Pythium oligandrum TaxID=41045 RepID=A0A8K1FCQ0_PYTOL|nr:hypothetical protein Poli38472_010119 [Pythium oligandrum]|eukprot:TMW58560.1 hypothetical protein Poli38472_010119 [Pythium oligandrum]